MTDFPTDTEARGITDYVQAHSFDDALCAECGTVRWEHAAHFLDFLAPLIRAREAAAKAQALIDFADGTRLPSHWILFRRDDQSGVTVSDLLRETAANYRQEADDDHN